MNTKQIGKTIAVVFFSGLAALLCTGTLIVIFGFFFWGLDALFGFVNLSPRFEYDVLALLRSTFFWQEDVGFKTIFFVLWAVVITVALKSDWVKKKLTWIKEKLWTHQ